MKQTKEIISFDREILKNANIRIYSKAEEDKLNYVVSLDSKDGVKDNKDRIVLATLEKGNLREVKKQLRELFKLISDGKVEEEVVEYSIRQLQKDSDISLTNEMQEIISKCIDRNNRKLEEISITKELKLEELISSIDYRKMDKVLPVEERINLQGVSEETIKEVEQGVQQRLTELKSITSKEDAELYKNSLEDFMTYSETETDRGKIILALIKKINNFDIDTLIATLKAIEDTDIKYSKLYPIYLRIQETRIIDKVQRYFISLKLSEKVPDGQIERFLEVLEGQKIEDLENTDLNKLIADFTARENDELEEYLKDGRKQDIDMIKYIKTRETEESEVGEERKEVLQYLEERVASVRQVGKEFEEVGLRRYIETTEFKEPDEKDQDVFLYKVAEMELKYLISKYREIEVAKEEKQRLSSRGDNEAQAALSLSEYNDVMDRLERDEKATEDLSAGYNRLMQEIEGKTGDKGRDEE